MLCYYLAWPGCSVCLDDSRATDSPSPKPVPTTPASWAAATLAESSQNAD